MPAAPRPHSCPHPLLLLSCLATAPYRCTAAGERNNESFFLHYGFLPPRNPHDDVALFPGRLFPPALPLSALHGSCLCFACVFSDCMPPRPRGESCLSQDHQRCVYCSMTHALTSCCIVSPVLSMQT